MTAPRESDDRVLEDNWLEDHWQQLVTGALLGTDRRDPPAPPPGPIADLVADAMRTSPAARLLADVAATAAVRRAAFVPNPPVDRLAPPGPDDRPWCPVAAVSVWRDIRSAWPVLEDEWVAMVIHHGWRLAPDVTVELLLRSRSDPVRTARVVAAAGPVAAWLIEHVPELDAPDRSPAVSGSAAVSTPPGLVDLPELPVTADLRPLLDADTDRFVRLLLPGFLVGRFGAPHRAVLVNVLARCRPEVLADAAAALSAVDHGSPSIGLALQLADLARLRVRMFAALDPDPGASASGHRDGDAGERGVRPPR